jgi:hypothetical protein
MQISPEILQAKAGAESDLLKLPGVIGVGIGFKEQGGQKTPDLAIRVYVATKKPKKELTPEQVIPAKITGVLTDVVEGSIELRAGNPLRGGVSIGPCRTPNGGTLGCIVHDNARRYAMLLSCFHVLAVDNGWQSADRNIRQPDGNDGGACPEDVVGLLERASLGGSVDCAVARIFSDDSLCDIIDIGQVKGTNAPHLNDAVRKHGKKTGLTSGVVVSVEVTITNNYPGIGPVMLNNQFGIQPRSSSSFSGKGDSGSAIVNEAGEVVGLLWGGNSITGEDFANPISEVMKALDITICSSPPPAFDPSPHQFSPIGGTWDSEVTLFGRNFDAGTVRVFFGEFDEISSSPLSVTSTQIVVRVPAGTGAGPLIGPQHIIVTTDGGRVTSDDSFNVIPT